MFKTIILVTCADQHFDKISDFLIKVTFLLNPSESITAAAMKE